MGCVLKQLDFKITSCRSALLIEAVCTVKFRCVFICPIGYIFLSVDAESLSFKFLVKTSF